MRWTLLSLHSTKHQQRVHIIAGLLPSSQSTLVLGRWSVVLRPSASICLSRA